MALKPGDEVDRYRIVAPLGAGGMGEVYHAIDTRLQRSVALKLLHPQKDGEEGTPPPGSGAPSGSRGSARMLREARAAAQLEHPNVVHVYDVGELQEPEALRGTAFLAMELIKGRPLRAFLKDASIPMAERVRWLSDIARALSVAHASGLVHRDIKPENVMVRDDGVVKVLDFGIAKRAGYGPVDPTQPTEEPQIVPTLTTKGVVIGTPYYMSPEQMRGDALDGRADQFSWGVLAYELLTGKGPWRTDTDALGLVSQVLSKPVDLPREHNPEIPMHVAYVVVRALAKAREDRFPSMDALVAALGDGAGSDEEAPAAASSARRGLATAGADTPEARAPTERSTAAASPVPRAPVEPLPAPARLPSRALAAGAVVAVAIAAFAIFSFRRAPTAPREGATSATVTPPACTTSSACIAAHGGAAYLCREGGRCVPLASEDCVVQAEPGDVGNDATIWIGTLFHKADFNQSAVELGRRDFASIPRALPGAGGNVVRRSLAVLACDDEADPARAAKHLVEEVGVPAVIGFSRSQEAIDLLTAELVPHGVLTLVSLNTSSQITTIRTPAGKPRTILRTTNNTIQMTQALAAFSAEVVEPRLAAERHHPLKVALVRPENASGLAFSDAVVSNFRVNGATVAEGQASFTEYVPPLEIDEKDPAIEVIRRALLATRVDVLLYYGGEYNAAFVAPLEAAWPAREPRPTYLSALPLGDDDLAALKKSPGALKRVFGVTTPSNTPINTKFTLHYNATFPVKVSATVSPATTYDAFYTLAYAAYTVGQGPITGESLAAGTRRLVGPGPKVEVGPAKILEALGVLGSGASLDLQGAGSDLDFDPVTGESPSDHAILCAGIGPSGAAQGVESGLLWDAKTGKLRGAMRCPL